MPSLFNVSESDPIQSAKPKECGNDIIVLDADADMEVATEDESQTDNKGPQLSNPALNKQSGNDGMSIDDPIEVSDEKDSQDLATSESSTPNSKKRRVTPNDDSGSKQKQQKKVNQMTLSSFFFKGNKATTSVSTPSKTPQRTASSAPKTPTPSSTGKQLTEKKLEDSFVPIEVDKDTNELQPAATPSKAMQSTPKPATKTENKTETSVETESKHGSAVCEVEIAAEVPETKPTNEPSTANPINVLSESVVKKKPRAKTAKSKKTSPKKTGPSGKESTARKPKKTKALDSLVTNVEKKELSESDLTDENRSLLQKYRTMKERYLERVHDVTKKHRDGLPEEDLGTITLQPITDDTELKTNEAGSCEDFPSQVVANMALLIEGSPLPLSQLVAKVCSELKGVHNVTWSAESVSEKIKLSSQRKAHFDNIEKGTDIIDLFEDTNQDRLWRWEITILDLLNSDVVSKARKARNARKKVSSYHSSLLKLIKSLVDTEKQILNPARPNLDKSKAKISRDEEKVLKFERDAEKQRLAEEAKARKLREQIAKKKAKEEALEAKKREREEAAEEKRKQKEEAARAREEEKRKKEEEKLQKEEAKKREQKKKQETFFKQKATFRSFFAAPKKEASDEKKIPTTSCADNAIESFDAESFRSKINSSPEPISFSMKGRKRSSSALASRKRKTKLVTVSVYKTVKADPSEWGALDYLEKTTIKVPNRYRYLSFHEDCRPAYRGTWTKKSSSVTGKNPFGKESIFDYEYDSELEWEEGDDEMGENVDDDSKNQEDDMDGEGNAKMYDFDDGFCVADDQLLDNEEDADEDTKALYKKKMLSREQEEQLHSKRIRIIAPGFGGVPLHLAQDTSPNTNHVEGFETDEVSGVLTSYKGIQLSDPMFCLDPFPQLPPVVETPSKTNANSDPNKDEYTTEAVIALARFCHHSTHNSKEKLIEELRTLHPTIFSVRAKATRKLDAISIKKKHPKYAGVYWEVKKEVLTELGLTDLLEKKVEDIVYDSSVPLKAPPPSEKSKAKTSPKGKGKSADSTKNKKGSSKKTKAPAAASKKRKSPTKAKSAPKSKPKKKVAPTKIDSLGTVANKKAKKESPKKKEDVSAGMKNMMAQFVKKSPVKASAGSQDIAEAPSSSQ